MNHPLLRVAAAQITSTADSRHNVALVDTHARRAAAQGARLIVFPEATLACFGTDLAAVAEPLDGPFATAVRALAGELGVTLVVGTFVPSDDGRITNTLLVTGPEGETRYDKIHLYDAFGSRESDTIHPGSHVVTTTVEGIRVGFATCYDLRFADHFTALGRAGAELVVVPASWGEGPGKSVQWDLLTRARAMDSQSWLLACDQAWTPPVGTDPLGVGESRLVNPLGGIRAGLGPEAGLLTADVDVDTVVEIRARIPIL